MTAAITPLPAAPQRSDPGNFAIRGDAFVTALPIFVTEANALAVYANLQSTNAANSANTAAAQVPLTTQQVALATSQAGIATLQAGYALDYANTSIAQALISTNQAVIATTKASESNLSAVASAASAAEAVVSANAAHASELNAVAVVTGGTASLTAAATKMPISDSNSLLDSTWLENNASYQKLNEGINYATDLAGHAVDDLSRSKALTATAGKIPVSGNDAMIDSTWLENNASYQKLTAGLAYAVDIAGKASSPIALPADTKTGTSTGNPGNIAYDSSYLYICTAKNVWKRISLTAF